MKVPNLTQWVTRGGNLKIFLFVLAAAFFSACGEEEDPYAFDVEGQKKIDEQIIRKYFRDNNVDTTQVVRTASGLYYLELKPGTGAEIKTGNLVEAHYIGRLTNNSIFDSSYERGNPITFVVDQKNTPQSVIEGWNEAVKLMKVGGESRLFIPSHLAYGNCYQCSLPPNSVLVFDIEVLRVK